jgi:molecular chaperone DnaK (HSP70)
MIVSVGGPQSEIEAEAQKKLITEREIKVVLEDSEITPKELRKTKARMQELLSFYDRIIRSIHQTIKTVESKTQLSQQQKEDRYLITQKKELSQAKAEKSKFRRYLKKVNDKLSES